MKSLTPLPRPLTGIVPPMVTPLMDRDTLDVEGLERLIEHITAGGVSGLFILGTTGEAPSLSYRLRRDVITQTCRQVAKRLPVLVGITDTSFVESTSLASHAAAAGARAVVLSAPYYFPPGQPELLQYLEHIVPELPLPLFLYNMPSLTKVSFAPETVQAALHMPGVVGIKDSSGNMPYFHTIRQLLAERRDWSLLIGNEQLLGEAVLMGSHGGVCGGANVHPQLFVGLYHAARQGDIAEVRRLHDQVQLFGRLYQVGHYGSAGIKGLKCALSCMGICSDFMAEPFHRFEPSERKIVLDILSQLGLQPNASP